MTTTPATRPPDNANDHDAGSVDTLYRLSPTGVQVARTELAALSAQLRLPSSNQSGRLRPEGGRA